MDDTTPAPDPSVPRSSTEQTRSTAGAPPPADSPAFDTTPFDQPPVDQPPVDQPPVEPPPFDRPPFPPPPAGPPPAGGGGSYPGWTPPPPRRPGGLLRRSRSDRVGVGLCGGLGRYFALDPVIFRIVFAVLALFGGSGVILYLLGWAAIPDAETVDAPLDRAVRALRRHHVPFAVAVAVALIVGWLALFSWWTPNSGLPAVVVIVVAVFVASRRRGIEPVRWSTGGSNPGGSNPGGWAPGGWDPTVPSGGASAYQPASNGQTDVDPYGPPAGYDAGAGVSLTKTPGADPRSPAAPAGDLRGWYSESRTRGRARRARSRPLAVTTALLATAALGVLVLADATRGIPLAAYFWTLGGIALGGLLVGLVARRTPWSVALLLPPAILGLVIFGGSRSSAHDGWGERFWSPTSTADLSSNYRLAFGSTTLDLSGVAQVPVATTTRVRQAAGEVRLVIPRTLPVRVDSDVHMGNIEVDGVSLANGVNFSRTDITAAPTAGRPVLVIEITLTAGQVTIVHTG